MSKTPFGPEDMARRKKRAIAMALILGGLVACSSSPPSCALAAPWRIGHSDGRGLFA